MLNKATPDSSRRRLTAAAVVALATSPFAVSALAQPAPDAELIAVCNEFTRLEHQLRTVYDGPNQVVDDDEAEAAARPFLAQQDRLLDRMQHLRAATPDGIQARVGALADYAGEFELAFDDPETRTGRLLHYILRDSRVLKGTAA